MAYNVIQWGTGSVGKIALRAMLSDEAFKVIGVKVYGDAKVGQDAGAIVSGATTGVKAVKDIDALPLNDADCVVYCPMVADYDSPSSKKAQSGIKQASASTPTPFGAAAAPTPLNVSAQPTPISEAPLEAE